MKWIHGKFGWDESNSIDAQLHGISNDRMNQDDQLTMRIDSDTKVKLRVVAEAAGMKRAEWIRKKINESFAKLKR